MSGTQEAGAPAPTPNESTEDATSTESEVPAEGKKQIRKEQFRVLYTSPGFIIGVLIVGFWIVASVLPGILTSFNPKEFVEAGPRVKPSSEAWLGTDKNGWDVYTRVIYGARKILTIAPISTAVAIVVGTFLGLIMGYYKGWVDEILSRVIEAILSIPIILMAIVIIFTFGRSTTVIIGTIAVLFVPAITRTIRSAAIAESDLDYVVSAKMRGESGFFIVTREILPNVTGLVVVKEPSASATPSSRIRRWHSWALSVATSPMPTGVSTCRRTTNKSLATSGGRRSSPQRQLPASSLAST